MTPVIRDADPGDENDGPPTADEMNCDALYGPALGEEDPEMFAEMDIWADDDD